MSEHDTGRAAGVVRFWRTIELFTPQNVPKVEAGDKGKPPVYSLKPGDRLPWEAGHALQGRDINRSKYAWKHTVYLGCYQIEDAYSILDKLFEPDAESYDVRPSGHSALAAFTVDDDGRLMTDSFLLSTCGWATGRSFDPGHSAPDWLDGFRTTQATLAKHLGDLVGASESDSDSPATEDTGPVGSPLTADAVAEFTTAVTGLLRLQGRLPCGEIRVQSRQVRLDWAHEVDGSDFLNSFILEDLDLVSRQIDANDVGKGLLDYLREDHQIDTSTRVDVRQDLASVYEASAPDKLPPGRWPSSSDKPLAMSQQLAVNTIMARLQHSSGLSAVNGPPGTGKTTMLKDIIATIVVERAIRLATLETPDDAFVGKEKAWKSGKFSRAIHTWREDLTGFEIVVASSNNGAVDNVTREIPGIKAVDAEWLEHADYFREIATAVLSGSKKAGKRNTGDDPLVAGSPEPDQKGWALAAARLGRKSNRYEFAEAFWPLRAPDEAAGDKPRVSMRALMQSFEKQEPDQPWAEAVAEFNTSKHRVDQLIEERMHAHRLPLAHHSVRREVNRWSQDLDRLGRVHNDLAAQRSQLVAEARMAGGLHEAAARRRRNHREFRPGLLESIFTGGRKLRTWSRVDSQHADATTSSSARQQNVEEQLARVRQQESEAPSNLELGKKRQLAAAERLKKTESELHANFERWGDASVDPKWWTDVERRERAGLWLDRDLNAARTELFLAAQRLHKGFLQHAATKIRQGLDAARDVLTGNAPPRGHEQAVLSAWQTLFFVVPVVSSTFAAFDRMFSHLGRESLGWLLIDEAGQSTPQNPVGAIWRSRRTVLVGDPLQLEPVVTLSARTQGAIRKRHGVSETWLPSVTSAQGLADRLTPWGTFVSVDDAPLWVGTPLRVHRRCENPMFDLSNRIAYEGQMIHATRYAEPCLIQEESCWLDVVTPTSQGHFVPKEFNLLVTRLEQLQMQDFPMKEIICISPFRDVAIRLEGLKKTYGETFAAGTIHTAQGREADVVFLVLGGDPRKEGAKKWAASSPNLANVAVSRAKRRIYVIGDHGTWSRHEYFKTIAQRLPVMDPFAD